MPTRKDDTGKVDCQMDTLSLSAEKEVIVKEQENIVGLIVICQEYLPSKGTQKGEQIAADLLALMMLFVSQLDNLLLDVS